MDDVLIMKGAGESDRALLEAILSAYPDRVTVRRAHDAARGVMVGGRGIVLEPWSVVRQAPLFLSVDPRDPGGSGHSVESRVGIASAIEEEWLEKRFPHLFERKIVHRFDVEQGKVVSVRQSVFVDLVVREDAVGARGDEVGASRALVEYLDRDAEGFFAADQSSAAWLARVRFLRRWMPELRLPAFEADTLREVLRAVASGAIRVDQVKRRGLRAALESRLTWQQRRALDEHSPEALRVPSGNRIRLSYSTSQETGAPVLAVRLQELFGLNETPRVAKGRVPVVLHLLGPNYRAVQVTDDLKSFWSTTYLEVRKELRARYPRHPWPEDPWNAQPVSVGGRRRK